MIHTHHGEDYRDIDGVCGCTTITHGQARRIAAEWHGGQSTALCALATSGYVDKVGLEREIGAELTTSPGRSELHISTEAERELTALLSYIRDRRLDGPCAGNSSSDYDGTPV